MVAREHSPLQKEMDISNKKIKFAAGLNQNDPFNVKYLSLLLADPPCMDIQQNEENCLNLNKVLKGVTRCVWLDSISGAFACSKCSESTINECNDYCTSKISAICLGDAKTKKEDPCGVCND